MVNRSVEAAKKGILSFLKSTKGQRVLVLCGVVGMVLLMLSEILPHSTEEKRQTISTDEYTRQTEGRLKELLSCIEGVGECHAMVTLENGVEYVYATEQKSNTDRQEDSNEGYNKVIQRDDNEESIIVIDTGNGREGLLVTEIQPTVKGVVIVCEGGDREEVRQQVIQAVTVALNISSKRVCVTKLS